MTTSHSAADSLLRVMKRDGIPLTRQNYIEMNWPEKPEQWTAEHEADLPEQFRDWSRFKSRLVGPADDRHS
jgi:hypothetical protein